MERKILYAALTLGVLAPVAGVVETIPSEWKRNLQPLPMSDVYEYYLTPGRWDFKAENLLYIEHMGPVGLSGTFPQHWFRVYVFRPVPNDIYIGYFFLPPIGKIYDFPDAS